jgi:hypothetical protein
MDKAGHRIRSRGLILFLLPVAFLLAGGMWWVRTEPQPLEPAVALPVFRAPTPQLTADSRVAAPPGVLDAARTTVDVGSFLPLNAEAVFRKAGAVSAQAPFAVGTDELPRDSYIAEYVCVGHGRAQVSFGARRERRTVVVACTTRPTRLVLGSAAGHVPFEVRWQAEDAAVVIVQIAPQ